MLIEGNQVNLARDSPYQFCNLPGMIHRMIGYIPDQNIFKGHSIPGLVGMGFTGSHQNFQGIFTIDRHDLVSNFIIGGIEAYSQPNPPVSHLFHLGNQSRGGKGDFFTTDIQTKIRLEDFNGPGYSLNIVQRLSHSHKNNIGYLLIPHVSLHLQKLSNDFIGTESVLLLLFTRQTESAGHIATHL